jgi:hypothetical protein
MIPYPLKYQQMKYGLMMVGLDKQFFNPVFTETEKGTVKGLDALQKGAGYTYTEVTFESKFGSSEDKGSGTFTRYPDDTVDAIYEGSVMIDGERVEWQSFETGKVDKDGKVKGLEIVTFPHSPNMKSFIMETEMDLSSGDFTNTAYRWK